MKKIFTLLSAAMITFNISAQTAQGGFLITGSTGLDYSTQKGERPSGYNLDQNQDVESTAFDLKIQGGYFIADNLLLGLAINRSSESFVSTENTTLSDGFNIGEAKIENTNSDVTFIFAPTIRYYFNETGAWIQTSYGFGSFTSEYEESIDVPSWYGQDQQNKNEVSSPMTILSIQGGYAIYLSEYVSINPTIGYAFSNITIEDGIAPEYVYDAFGNIIDYQSAKDLEISTSGLNFGLGIAFHIR